MSKEASSSFVPTAPSTEPHKHTNRLAQEKSPYLLQHAHNPVDWYPWGEEAIERARSENKLIFLSVGYSTCHWCHVMERESFENEAVAAIMNKHFINVKVDREERPDIDKIYMQFVLMLNGSGGWPMSVWLTPDLAPITAGTYFPPQERWGMPSFTTVLNTIAEKWSKNEIKMKATGREVIAAIQKSVSEKSEQASFEPGSADAKLQEALNIFKQSYDQQHGGFGAKPKFPEVSRLNLLLHAYIVTKDMDVLDMALQTLQHIGHGGIHDHVFGGFARYSVDRQWHVPHFEKMLYDQGQLLAAYSSAYKLTRNEQLLRYADSIYRYIMKDLRHPQGGFYSGEDADSLPDAASDQKVEGAFYAWTWEEVKNAMATQPEKYEAAGIKLPRACEIYAYHYDIKPAGNVAPASDPHGHLTAKNILIVRGSEEETCAKFDISAAQLHQLLDSTNELLHKLRDQRPRPHLDTKIVCAWNGLVLSGLAKLSACGSTHSEEYLQAATKLLSFMRAQLYDSERKMLWRSCYGTEPQEPGQSIDGFLDDYAFLIRGVLDFYKLTLDKDALQWAKELQDTQDRLFWDSKDGAYFYSQANAQYLVVRLKEDHDGAEPCGNSVSARNLTLLAHYYDDEAYRQRANQLFEFFSGIKPFGYALPQMMSALLLHEHGIDLVAVVGSEQQQAKRFLDICRKYYVPGLILFHVDPTKTAAPQHARLQQKFKMIDGKTTVYICHNRVCRLPITDPDKLEKTFSTNYFASR